MKITTINKYAKNFITKKINFLENEIDRIKKERKDILKLQNIFNKQ